MEKERKQRRSIFNLFDLVLIVIAVALGVILFLNARQDEDPAAGTVGLTGDRVNVRFTVEIQEAEEVVTDILKEGEPLVDREKKYNLGTVESVEVGPAFRAVTDYETQTYRLTEVPGLYRALVTVTTEGVADERSITVDGGYVVRVGKTVYGKVPGGAFSGTIVAIERVEK